MQTACFGYGLKRENFPGTLSFLSSSLPFTHVVHSFFLLTHLFVSGTHVSFDPFPGAHVVKFIQNVCLYFNDNIEI